MPTALKLLILMASCVSLGATHVTPNFVVTAPTQELARRAGETAELHRERLAVFWFGHVIKPWSQRCRMTVVPGDNLGAGGATKFKFDQGEVFGWDMRVQGTAERILDSVIPHEVNHTILACYFRRPVPRWADEGAASLMEHESERGKQQQLVDELIHDGRRIPLRVLLDMKEYPKDMHQVMALYAEGYSLTQFLIQSRGRESFLRFLDDAHHRGWDAAVQSFYAKSNVEKLEREWSSWVLAGSPALNLAEGELLAQQPRNPQPKPAALVRAQNPDQSQAAMLKDSLARRRQALQAVPLLQPSDLSAPDPRARGPQPVALTALEPVRKARFEANRQASPQVQPSQQQRVQPLELVRLDDSPATSRSQNVSPAIAGSRNTSEATARPSAHALHRETRLRSDRSPAAPTSDRFLDWSHFPSRVR